MALLTVSTCRPRLPVRKLAEAHLALAALKPNSNSLNPQLDKNINLAMA